jgi:hypothetical protein
MMSDATSDNGQATVSPLDAYKRTPAVPEEPRQPTAVPDPAKQLEAYKSRAATIAVGKKPVPRVTALQVRKRNDQEYVRVKPATQVIFPLFRRKDGDSLYLFMPDVEPFLDPKHIRQYKLVLAKSLRAVTPFIWPLPLPLDDLGHHWHVSALTIAQEAETGWVKVVSDMAGGTYVSYPPACELPDPEWPSEPFETLVWLGFANHRLDSHEHPVIRQLQGRDA